MILFQLCYACPPMLLGVPKRQKNKNQIMVTQLGKTFAMENDAIVSVLKMTVISFYVEA